MDKELDIVQIKKILFKNKPKPKQVKVISYAKKVPASVLFRDEFLHEGTDSDEAVETDNVENVFKSF